MKLCFSLPFDFFSLLEPPELLLNLQPNCRYLGSILNLREGYYDQTVDAKGIYKSHCREKEPFFVGLAMSFKNVE
jgi:hypothetical protein